MSGWIIGILGVAIALLVLRGLRSGSDVAGWAHHAAHSGDLHLLVRHIETSGADTANAWDQAITTLWQTYQRETAARLVVEAAKRTDAPVVQYWIRRFQEVEPDIASEHSPTSSSPHTTSPRLPRNADGVAAAVEGLRREG